MRRRASLVIDALGQPVYDARDDASISTRSSRSGCHCGWLVGMRHAAGVREHLRAHGAAGVQVGTAFAF